MVMAGHRPDCPSRTLLLPRRVLPPARPSRNAWRLFVRRSLPAATTSRRTCSGSLSVYRSALSAGAAASECPVVCERGNCAAGLRPDLLRSARFTLPIRTSSAASSLLTLSSSVSSAASVITTVTCSGGAVGVSSAGCGANVAATSSRSGVADAAAAPDATGASAPGTRFARQTGQVTCDASQASMQSAWNACEHLGRRRSVSSSSNSLRHTAHSSSPLPTLCALTSA
uniref:Uncharacterized protein n=1 Tax=Triticum urartu TaxID=4572 RepID=A0A8R7URZ8_TRIUA